MKIRDGDEQFKIDSSNIPPGPVLSSLIKENCDAHCHFQHCPDEIEVPEFKSSFEKIDSKDFNLSVHV